MTRLSPTAKLAVSNGLLLASWLSWSLFYPARIHSKALAICWVVGMAGLFVWGFVVRRVDRRTALIGWISIIVMLLLAGVFSP
jgi:hypothetical protein